MTSLGEHVRPPPLPGRYLVRDPEGYWSAAQPLAARDLLEAMNAPTPPPAMEGWSVLYIEPAAEPFPM